MKSLNTILAMILATVLYSCGHVDAELTLRQAESDVLAGNIERAVSSCDMLADSSSTQQLTSTQMCRMAILYARISDISDDQDYMATAAQYFERALTLDNTTDSIDRYIESLDVESQSIVRVIREVSHSLSSPCDYTQDHEDDAEYSEDQYMETPEPKATASL